MHNQVDTEEHYDLASFEVNSSYFKEQCDRYEEKYRAVYPNGWGQFFAAYSNGEVDKGNLDYDEWGFLCEHLMRQKWTPPTSIRTDCQGKPELNSGFLVVGATHCLIPRHTFHAFRNCCATAMRGKIQYLRPQASFMTARKSGR